MSTAHFSPSVSLATDAYVFARGLRRAMRDMVALQNQLASDADKRSSRPGAREVERSDDGSARTPDPTDAIAIVIVSARVLPGLPKITTEDARSDRTRGEDVS